jgi:hypothetical protein
MSRSKIEDLDIDIPPDWDEAEEEDVGEGITSEEYRAAVALLEAIFATPRKRLEELSNSFQLVAFTTRLKYEGSSSSVQSQLQKILPDMAIEVRKNEREGEERLATITFGAPDPRVPTPAAEAHRRIRDALKFLGVQILEN